MIFRGQLTKARRICALVFFCHLSWRNCIEAFSVSPLAFSVARQPKEMSPTQVNALAQYSSEAASLFNNMKTPASIISGALVPLGMMSPLELESPKGSKEGSFRKTLRILYRAVAVLSLCSELLAVIWATVASNQLIETSIAPAESVW